MTREAFDELSGLIINHVGESVFRSESYIDNFLVNKNHLYMAHCLTSGGWISGETRLAITLRILAGGNSYDIGVIFDITPKHCNKIMRDVLRHWINKTRIGGINIYEYLQDDQAMSKVSYGFSKRSNGIFKGAIGALDGWLVRITRPNKK